MSLRRRAAAAAVAVAHLSSLCTSKYARFQPTGRGPVSKLVATHLLCVLPMVYIYMYAPLSACNVCCVFRMYADDRPIDVEAGRWAARQCTQEECG